MEHIHRSLSFLFLPSTLPCNCTLIRFLSSIALVHLELKVESKLISQHLARYQHSVNIL